MKKPNIFVTMLIISAISFAGCGNSETVNNSVTESVETTEQQNNTQEDNTTKETTAEETTAEEPETEEKTEENTTEEIVTEDYTMEDDEDKKNKIPEYTCEESNIPLAMIENVKKSTEYEIGAYLYGNIDDDEDKELLAAYLDESVGQWKILKLENESSEPEEFYSIQLAMYFDRCSMNLIGLKDKIHYVVNLYASMGLGSNSYVLEESKSGMKEILYLIDDALWQSENGDVVIQSTYYGTCFDKISGMMMGRTWGYSYLTYDEESGQYKEYVANEITEEEFLAYEGAAECLEGIRNSFFDTEVKITFFRRKNGLMHIQCETETETLISYGYYTVDYENNEITNVREMEEGFISKNFTTLDEA